MSVIISRSRFLLPSGLNSIVHKQTISFSPSYHKVNKQESISSKMFINEQALLIISEVMQDVCMLDLAETLRIIKPKDNWVLKFCVSSLRPDCKIMQELPADEFRVCLMEIYKDHEADFKLDKMMKR